MRVVTYMGSDTRTARSVGGDAGSSVTVGPQGPPHVFAHRDEGPCARYRAAGSPPVLTAPVVDCRDRRRLVCSHHGRPHRIMGTGRTGLGLRALRRWNDAVRPHVGLPRCLERGGDDARSVAIRC